MGEQSGGGGPLDTAQLAAFMGWQATATVRRALWETRRKLKYRVPLGPRDLPLPDASVGRSPRWTLATAEEFRTAYRTLQPIRAVRISRSKVRPRRPDRIAVGDVIVHEDGRLEHVLDVVEEGGAVRLLVRRRSRDAGRWLPLTPDDELAIFRPPPPER